MGWQMAAMAAMTAVQSANEKSAADKNAGIMAEEGNLAGQAANSNYAARLRKNAMMEGNNAAAAVQSGGGVGGSTKGVLDQNAVNMELDALNEKYGGRVRQYQFGQQADFDRTAGSQRATATAMSGVAKYLSASSASGSGWSMGPG